MTVRTYTYKVNMDLSGVKAGSKSMQVTLASMSGDTAKVDASIKKLADTISKRYGVSVSAAIDQTKTAQNSVRQMAREVNRAEKNFAAISREYRHMAARTGEATDRQEVMNAVFRLGAGATLSQKKEVVALVREYQRLRTEANKTQGSMRGLRGQASNVGFQLQDIAVQAQMGTNALVILGQQGSQLAAGFGAKGALIGAFIAIASAIAFTLSPSLKDAGTDIDELAEKIEEFGRKTVLTKAQADFLEDVELKKIKDYEKAIKDAEEELENIAKAAQTSEMQLRDILGEAYLKTAAGQKKYSEEMKRLNGQRGEEMTQAKAIIATSKQEIEAANKKIEAFQRLTKQSEEQQEADKKAAEEAVRANERIIKSTAEQARTIGLSASAISELNKARDLETLRINGVEEAIIEKVKADYDSIISNQKDAEQTKKRAEEEAALARQMRETAKFARDRLNTRAKYTDSGRLEQLKQQQAEELNLVRGHADAVNAINEHYARERTKINGTAWEKYAIQVEDAIKSSDEIMTQSLDRLVSGFGNAMTQVIFESESLGDALEGMFKSAISAMVQFFAEWAAQKLILWALDKTLGKTAQAGAAGVMSANASAQVVQAGLNAFTSVAAIPMVGPFMAPAAAAAAVAATAPMAATVATLASLGIAAYDKGGMIPAGSAGIVAEIGDELVGGTMIYNGSQSSLGVTGREDTARMMKGGTSIGSINITSSGNASPEAIGRAVVRAIERKSKKLDTAIYDSMNRGKTNRGKRFNA